MFGIYVCFFGSSGCILNKNNVNIKRFFYALNPVKNVQSVFSRNSREKRLAHQASLYYNEK